MRVQAVPDVCVNTLNTADVSKTFKQVNIHKAAGLDRLPERVLRAYADQLASVFTDIFVNPNPPRFPHSSPIAVPQPFETPPTVPPGRKYKIKNTIISIPHPQGPPQCTNIQENELKRKKEKTEENSKQQCKKIK
jgi:hypothetical protein